jgi:hypothetical protein
MLRGARCKRGAGRVVVSGLTQLENIKIVLAITSGFSGIARCWWVEAYCSSGGSHEHQHS